MLARTMSGEIWQALSEGTPYDRASHVAALGAAGLVGAGAERVRRALAEVLRPVPAVQTVAQASRREATALNGRGARPQQPAAVLRGSAFGM